MIKIAFVVLHYETLDDTSECIDSLKKYIVDDSVKIVVVDNGSVHGKLNTIEEKYKSDSVIFLYSDENLGFAKGNNIGFKYAKEKLQSDIIILANNDLIFRQEDFVDKLITYGKDGSLVSRRKALAFLHNDKDVVNKVFNELAPRYAERNGGYTRKLKVGNRRGDDAPIVLVTWVD